MDRRLEANRRTWDVNARIHASGSAAYRIDRLLARRPPWAPKLPDDLGNVRGKSILHLQCHIGTDSLRWAWEGARVTGVDFSPRAIREARTLSRRARIPARFVLSNITELPHRLRGQFDIVMTYYGTIVWLPDLTKWARVIAHFLKPGGFFYIADSHPMALTFEYDRPGDEPRIAYRYFPGKPDRFVSTQGTYADLKAKTGRRVSYEWHHSLEEITHVLNRAGLTVQRLREFPYTFYDMAFYTGRKLYREDARGFWHLRGNRSRFPLMFSLKAVKP
ncbi:MAG: methyltransferase domain-containing protein [Candidatus Coatesbacteria bacterium]